MSTLKELLQCDEFVRHYTVNVTDEAGSLLAVFQGLVYRKQQIIGDTPAGR